MGGTALPGLCPADALGDGQRRRQFRIGDGGIPAPCPKILGVDDGQGLAGAFQIQIRLPALLGAQAVPAAAGHVGGLGDGGDGAEQIGGASSWCSHDPNTKSEHRSPQLLGAHSFDVFAAAVQTWLRQRGFSENHFHLGPTPATTPVTELFGGSTEGKFTVIQYRFIVRISPTGAPTEPASGHARGGAPWWWRAASS